MKKLLSIILIISACNASAQTYVKDTTEVDATLLVIPKTGTMKYDKIGVHPTITGQLNKATSDISGLQSAISPIPIQIGNINGQIALINGRIVDLEQGIPITVIDTPKRINVTGSSYTISEGDNGANIFCYSTCTIYAGHGTDKYKVNIYRLSGVVTILPMSGISLLSITGYRRIQQYGKAELMFEGRARVLLTGNLTK